ncbi:hypothetical protein HON22_00500, partial [Candidatus Peregrinibacteria bacterium]|nr:hypothetical protein [Candidatus Peregrinibacteria bacterium]
MSFAHEHIRTFRKTELGLILFVAILVSVVVYLLNFLIDPTFLFLGSLIVLVFGLNFLVHIIKKTGVVMLFFILISLFTLFINDIGIVGWKKIIVFLIAGLIFELSFLFLKIHVHNIPFDIVVGTSFSLLSIPLTTAFFLSPSLASSFPQSLLNVLSLAFVVGLITSVVASLLWHHFE